VTVCRTWVVNYTSDTHITKFEARSLGYPFGSPNPADKIVRSLALFVSDAAHNVNGDPNNGNNFGCQWGTPAGSSSRLLWHWSRSHSSGLAPTSWSPSSTVGVRLPALAKLTLQAVYDVESGSPDLRSLTSYAFWQEFAPFDESGIRLTLTRSLRKYSAAVFDVGSLDFKVPPMSISSVNHSCVYSTENANVDGQNMQVMAVSTRTGGALRLDTAVELSVLRPTPTGGVTTVWRSVSDSNVPQHDPLHFKFTSIEQSGLILRPGDTLQTRCVFNTKFGIPQVIPSGWEQDQELCLAHLYARYSHALYTQL
jgi:hypothetical protein